MVRPKQTGPSSAAISGSLEILAEIIGQIVEMVGEAQIQLADGRQREAINALTGVDIRLEEATSIQRAIRAMHWYR